MDGLTMEQLEQKLKELDQFEKQPASKEKLMQYFYSLAEMMEAASGTKDVELRSEIDSLRIESETVPTSSTGGMTYDEIAGELDRLSAKMDSVDKLLAEVEKEPETMNFLKNSSELWMPVITASAEERRAASSSAPSTAPSTNKDETNTDASH